jgi:hypothetical protein
MAQYLTFPLAMMLATIPGLDLPEEIQGWRADDPLKSYDPKTVYDYMDGNAEVYLSYGMKVLYTGQYTRSGELPVTLNVFEMTSPEAAHGIFTFERMDPGIDIGQGSEYGAGILRFWQGSYFIFIQAERETPAAREMILALGRLLAAHLEPGHYTPTLTRALPKEGFRPLSLRYALTPQLLSSLETLARDNALGLPARCEAVVGRYGKPGKPERILLAKYGDEISAKRGLEAFTRKQKPAWHRSSPTQGEDGWCYGIAQGTFVILVLDALDSATARTRLETAMTTLKEVDP